MASRWRENSFSLASSALRAASHSFSETILGPDCGGAHDDFSFDLKRLQTLSIKFLARKSLTTRAPAPPVETTPVAARAMPEMHSGQNICSSNCGGRAIDHSGRGSA